MAVPKYLSHPKGYMYILFKNSIFEPFPNKPFINETTTKRKKEKKKKKKENTLYLKNKLKEKLYIKFVLIVTSICSNQGS